MQSLGISFNDIAQIDNFFEHVTIHNKKYGDSIIVFISKHYGELKADHQKEHQEEHEDHEHLPFSHSNCSHVSSIPAFVLTTNKHELKIPEFSEFRLHNFFYQEPSSSLHEEGLLQPPRLS